MKENERERERERERQTERHRHTDRHTYTYTCTRVCMCMCMHTNFLRRRQQGEEEAGGSGEEAERMLYTPRRAGPKPRCDTAVFVSILRRTHEEEGGSPFTISDGSAVMFLSAAISLSCAYLCMVVQGECKA